MIEISNITKIYYHKGNHHKALDDISLEFASTGLVSVLGKSGSGKTTLLKVLAGLCDFQTGKYIFNGSDISNYSETQMNSHRSRYVGTIFQNFNLIDEFNVFKNVSLPLYLQSKESDEVNTRVSNTLHYLGLTGYETRKTHELSGGEQQRIAIARALIKDSKVILADEPTGNLDSKTADIILTLLKNISKDRLVILVTHDEESAYKYSDRIIRIKDGKIISDKQNLTNDKNKRNIILKFYNEKMNLIRSITSNEMNNEKILNEIILSANRDCYIKVCVENLNTEKLDVIDWKRTKKQSFKDDENGNLPRKFINDIVYTSLSFQKIRLFFIILLLGLTATIVSLNSTFARYNKDIVISNYLDDNNIESIQLYQENCYINEFLKKYCGKNSNGEHLSSEISFVQESNIVKVIEDIGVKYHSEDDSHVPININYKVANENSVIYNSEILIGHKSSKRNEIVISDFLAINIFGGERDINNYLGEIIIDKSGTLLEVVGIIKTDYENSDLIYQYFNNELNDRDYELFKNSFYYGIINSSYVEYKKNNTSQLSLQKANFLNNYSYHLNNWDYTVYGTIVNIDSNDLLYGKLPTKRNEILVSSAFLLGNFPEFEYEENNFNMFYDAEFLDEVLNKQYKFDDIHDEKFDGIYNNIINISDFYENKVEIVGIYNTMDFIGQKEIPSIIVHDDIFSQVLAKYYSDYYFDSYLVYRDHSISSKSIVKTLSDKNILIYDSSIDIIYAYQKAQNESKSIIWFIVGILGLISIIQLNSFLSLSINSKSRQINILRSLGTSKLDLYKIFITESFFIGLSTFLLSVIMYLLVIKYINYTFQTTPNLYNKFNEFDIIYIDYTSIIIVFLLILSVSLATVIRSIHKLSILRFGQSN
jgi:putative ABC transport system permease protein